LEETTDSIGNFSFDENAGCALIERIKEGDASALISLYDKTSRLLFGIAMRVLGDRISAEETLLDLYTQIWKQPSSYPEDITILQWLIAMIRSNALARLHENRQNRKKEITAVEGESGVTVSKEQEIARSTIESLAQVEKETLELAYFRGLSCEEIAAQVGKPLGAVQAQIRSGLATMSKSFPAPSEEKEAN
jgi:RNA polymerase sigma-70 factor, ECF subfamily